MIVRHRLLKELVKLWNNNELVDKIDRLPIELSPSVEVQITAVAGTRYGGRD